MAKNITIGVLVVLLIVFVAGGAKALGEVEQLKEENKKLKGELAK